MKLPFYIISISLFLGGCKRRYTTSRFNGFNQAVGTNITMDSNIVKMYNPYKKTLELTMNKQISTVSNSCIKDKGDFESSLGNFFADALLFSGKKINPSAQIAFDTRGGMRSEIEKGPITVDDIFQSTPYFNLFGGQIELELMSKLGYDAETFGNHEFDNGIEGLLKHFNKANFPFITFNYDFS